MFLVDVKKKEIDGITFSCRDFFFFDRHMYISSIYCRSNAVDIISNMQQNNNNISKNIYF